MQEQEIHLRDYLRIITKRRSIVLAFFLITFFVVLIGTFTMTPLYEANTQLLIEKNEVDPLGSGYITRYDPEFLETQYQIIKGFNVSRKVVDMLALDTKYAAYFEETSSGIRKWLSDLVQSDSTASPVPGSFSDTDVLTLADEIAIYISEEIEVKPVRNSRIVDISFLADNPVLAKMIVNTLARAYMEEILAIRMSSSEHAISWMTKKADEERAKLEVSEKKLQAYMKANNIITVENKIAVLPEKLSEFSAQLSKAEAKRKELESLFYTIQDIGPGNYQDLESLPQIAANQTYLDLREKIREAEQNIVELSKKYGRKHPMMIRAMDELKGLQQKKGEEINRLTKSIRMEYEQAGASEASLTQLLEKTKKEALRLNEKFIQYGILKRDVDTNKVLYEALLKKAKEQSVTEQTNSVNVWIVAEAKTPPKPAKPKKLLNILLGIVLGAFGGIGLAFFVEYLDNTIKEPEETETRLGLSVLGVVQLLKDKETAVHEALLKNPMSAFAECYKTLRSTVLLSSADQPPKTILLTSMSPQEGKTTTSINLAMAIAQAGNRVVLIDADLRRPSIHKTLGINNAKGLSTYLAGSAAGEEIIAEHPSESLSIIPSGPIPPDPSELLSSKRLKQLINQLEQDFDFVVIDTSPLMGATDALILSKVTSGTILVAKAGSTTYDIMASGLKTLRDIDAHLLGLVINRVDFDKDSYHSYYGYYHYSSAGSD